MWLAHFGFREQPFGVTPDPRFLYLSRTHREALASLYYGIQCERGFMTLVSVPGMGKTTLLFQLSRRVSLARSIFVFQTQCNSGNFLQYLATDLGIAARDPVAIHDQLNELVTREAKAGKKVVLYVDEAQNLQPEVLETIRLLSNFETPRHKLIQIILAGQPQLALRLAQPELVQLKQRISVAASLGPLDADETREYIDHRLRAVGYDGPNLFTPVALQLISASCAGVPRTINNICFNALTLAAANASKVVDEATVREVLADLDLHSSVTDSVPEHCPVDAGSGSGNERLSIESSPANAAEASRDICVIASSKKAWHVLPRVAAFSALILLLGLISVFSRRAASPLSSSETVAPSPTLRLQPSHGKQSFVIYEVKQHDTVSSIVFTQFGISRPDLIQDIKKLNPSLHNPDLVLVGQKLVLPASISTSSSPRTSGE